MQIGKDVNLKESVKLVKLAAARWTLLNAPRMGAALAFYTILSLAPLTIFLVAIFDLVLRQAEAEHDLLTYASNLIGPSGAQTVQLLIENTHQASGGILATSIATITLLFGASGVFIELRASLNAVWGVSRASVSTWASIIRLRLTSFATVLALGFLLLFSMLATTALAVAEKLIGGFAINHFVWMAHALNEFGSFAFTTLLFVLIFRFVPDQRAGWREVLAGSIVTSILFAAGKVLLSWYLLTAGVGSAYGAAGSLVALVVWIYYSAQIVFFGALLTKVYGDQITA